MRRKPLEGSWIYLIREFDSEIEAVGALAAYLKTHNVLLWQKDCKPLAKRVKSGPELTEDAFPGTVRDECREQLASLLNDVLSHYRKASVRRQVQARRLATLRQAISLHEREQLRLLLETYGPHLNSNHRREARLETKRAIEKWMEMSASQKSEWFRLAVSVAEPRKRQADELRQRLDEEMERLRQEREKRAERIRRAQPISLARAYQVLGIPVTAGNDEIRRAWRQLVKQNHPDRGGDSAKFIEIQEAYKLLAG